MISCIIPFYNEKQRIVSVVSAVRKVKTVSQIICVDDGSQDNGSSLLEKNFPQITTLRLKSNLGKADAIFSGLDLVENEIIFLLDGDLVGLDSEDLNRICERFVKEHSLDMLILKPSGELLYKLIDWFFRNYIIQSGNRILRVSDLRQVKELGPKKYQLEVAINQYMLNNKKNVAWTPIYGFNPHKSSKTSFFQGFQEDIRMNREINNYLGIWRHLWQILFFARNKLAK